MSFDWTRLFFAFQCIASTTSTYQQCNVIIHSEFENCRYTSHVDTARHVKLGLHQCKNTSICRREFKISYINLQPYYEWKDLISVMVRFCCGACATLTTVNKFEDTSKLTMRSLATSDFVYPFLAPAHARQLYGFDFIPIIDVPSVYYITTTRRSAKETVLQMVKACAELWPMLLVCILLAAVFGFLVWIMETWTNAEEFSRSFFIGLFDGFWWAFISMTTVGFGDKCPRTWRARGVAVAWILTGITICSLFTASLTGKIISSIKPENTEMQGKKIGWLKHRLYEAKIIAHNGGRITAVQDESYLSGIKKLLRMLEEGVIHGFVLDKNIYNLFKITFSNRSNDVYDPHTENQFLYRTIIKEVFNKGDKLAFGLLVRNSGDNEYFRRYFTDNKLQVKSCNMLRLNSNSVSITKEINFFSLKAGLFWPSFGVALGALACICGFGIFFEVVRRQISWHLRKCHFMRRKDRSTSDHTSYQQHWINLFTTGDAVIGRNPIGRNPNSEDVTRRQLKQELSRQGISVLYLDNRDVLLFDQSKLTENPL